MFFHKLLCSTSNKVGEAVWQINQIQATEQCFSVVVWTFNWKLYWAVLSCSAVKQFVSCTIQFWICESSKKGSSLQCLIIFPFWGLLTIRFFTWWLQLIIATSSILSNTVHQNIKGTKTTKWHHNSQNYLDLQSGRYPVLLGVLFTNKLTTINEKVINYWRHTNFLI